MEIFWLQIQPSFYGFMYALSFWVGYYLIYKSGKIRWKNLEDLFFYIFLGVIVGGRLWYVVFYNPLYYINHILEIPAVWQWGMSFHGGVIGVIVAMILFARKNKLSFLMIADEVTRVIPLWLLFGRIGNYINKELLGFPYSGPLAVVTEQGSFFPSPLLEAFLEWAILFIILQYIYLRKAFDGQVAAVFLIGYGVFRIFVEVFFRTPDAHIGYIVPYVSLWTILSAGMIVWGVYYHRELSK